MRTSKQLHCLFQILIFVCGLHAFSSAVAGTHTILRSDHAPTRPPYEMQYGDQALGSSTSLTLDLTRDTYSTGKVERTFTVTDVYLQSGDVSEFSITDDKCNGEQLDKDFAAVPQDTCTIEITFSPTSEGAKEAVLYIDGTNGQWRDVILSGVSGLIDPSDDKDAASLIHSQAEMGKRITRVQISTISQRLERLHQRSKAKAVDSDLTDNESSEGSIYLNSAENDLFKHQMMQVNQEGSAGIELPSNTQGTELSGWNPRMLLERLQNAATTGTVDLSYSSPRTSGVGNSWLPAATGIWLGGKVQFGNRDASSDSSEIEFKTDGITLGVDTLINDDLILGASVGYAQGDADVGQANTKNESEGYSLSLYGSYSPKDNIYIDGLIGYGAIEHDMERFIAPLGLTAEADRDAEQIFGSLSVGYEYEKPGLLLSPYLRFDFIHDELDDATESGAGANNLVYDDQTVDSQRLSLGFRSETLRRIRLGWVQTRLRFEYNHDFEDEDRAKVYYANQPTSPVYRMPSASYEDDSFLIGIGNDFVFRNGLKFGLDYQVTQYSGSEYDQALGIWVSKAFDDYQQVKELSRLRHKDVFSIPLGIHFGYTYDDNVNRVVEGRDKLTDDIYNIFLGSGTSIPLTKHTRFTIRGNLEATRHRKYEKLSRNTIGMKGEYQYRPSGNFDAVTLGLKADLSLDHYDSDLRSGHRYSFGANIRQGLTDRINWFAEIARNYRDADDKVFDVDFDSVKLNVDYSLRRRGALYLTAEYRDGETVSSNPGGGYPGIRAVIDDAFPATHFAYQYDAETLLWTVGYNLPVGGQDSIDISWRRVESDPDLDPVAGYYDGSDYETEQFSIYYLMKF